jgi:hypothetical protein
LFNKKLTNSPIKYAIETDIINAISKTLENTQRAIILVRAAKEAKL